MPLHRPVRSNQPAGAAVRAGCQPQIWVSWIHATATVLLPQSGATAKVRFLVLGSRESRPTVEDASHDYLFGWSEGWDILPYLGYVPGYSRHAPRAMCHFVPRAIMPCACPYVGWDIRSLFRPCARLQQPCASAMCIFWARAIMPCACPCVWGLGVHVCHSLGGLVCGEGDWCVISTRIWS